MEGNYYYNIMLFLSHFMNWYIVLLRNKKSSRRTEEDTENDTVEVCKEIYLEL